MDVSNYCGTKPTFGIHTFRYCQSWAPLVSQNVQTDTAVGVDIRVVDSGSEVDLRWLEGVVCGKVDGQEEDTALERAVTLHKGVSVGPIYVHVSL
jgi:hypothetical protein